MPGCGVGSLCRRGSGDRDRDKLLTNDIISYREMCNRENSSLQRGMNYRLGGDYSVILMSVRRGAPYRDEIRDDGETLIYEGHDVPKGADVPDPKAIDQPEISSSGNLTENGKFHRAAQFAASGEHEPELVRVYEKLRQGLWSNNGLFRLTNSWIEQDENRNVFKFQLDLTDQEMTATAKGPIRIGMGRLIPSWVKQEVFIRDDGKCAKCGATDELHFDHILPFAKGGTSASPDNIQLLCARHNLEKRDKIL